MLSTLKPRLLSAALALGAALTLAAPKEARADLFGLWVKPKFDYLSGTGDVFKRFEGSPAGGIEAGIELLGLSLWGDYEAMKNEQYWATVNLGIDFALDVSDFTLTLGAYGGGVFFGFPPNEDAQGALDDNSAQISAVFMNAGLPDSAYTSFQSKYKEIQDSDAAISNMAFGLNARLRGSLEYNITDFISVGAQFSAGWHVVMSGEAASADVKSRAVDAFVKTQGAAIHETYKAQLTQELKDALGAEEVNTDDLKGVNYSLGAFVNFHI